MLQPGKMRSRTALKSWWGQLDIVVIEYRELRAIAMGEAGFFRIELVVGSGNSE